MTSVQNVSNSEASHRQWLSERHSATVTALLVRNGRFTPDELRETLIMLAPYAGHPNVSGLVVACEEVISKWKADGEPGPAEPTS
jgi:hypothetical protein